MAMLEIKRAEAQRDLKKFCSTRVPARLVEQLRYTFHFRGNDVTLFEERPPWNGVGTPWSQRAFARFRYEPDRNRWSLSWRRGNGRWSPCEWISEKARFVDVLAEVERDDRCTFFG